MVGSVDQEGRPWASLLAGGPGFISSPDPTTLIIAAQPVFGDPLNDASSPVRRLGFLGIDYQMRRRNRLTGRLTRADEHRMEIHDGNCPKFIQARTVKLGGLPRQVGVPRLRHYFRCSPVAS